MRILTLSLVSFALLLTACGQPEPQDTTMGRPPTLTPAYPAPDSAARVSAIETTVAHVRATLTPRPTPVLTTADQHAQGPRLRDLWSFNTRNARSSDQARYLTYVEPHDDANTQQRSYVFWRVDLQNPTQPRELFRRQAEDVDPIYYARLSADDQWIAFITDASNGKRKALYVAQTDGRNERIIPGGVATSYGRCLRGFVWSPTETRLAIKHYRHDGQTMHELLSIYDAETDTAQIIIQTLERGMEIIGWQDATHLLLLRFDHTANQYMVVRLTIPTGIQEPVGQIPVMGSMYCVQLTPDHQKIILEGETLSRLATLNYIFDLSTKAVTSARGASTRWVWDASAATYLIFPLTSDDQAQLQSPTSQAQAITLVPPHRGAAHFAFDDAASDGSSLVTCTIDESHGVSLWVYNTIQDHWTALTKNTLCAHVIGWTATP